MQSLEQVLEMAFLKEVKAAGQLWVVKNGADSIYSEEIEPMRVSVPIWSNRESVFRFLSNAGLSETRYEPMPIPLEDFTRSWLSDTMAIAELQLNPDRVSQEVLVLSPANFKMDVAANQHETAG
jgi:hypothetical protein